MFFTKKRSNISTQQIFSEIRTDMHSHLLPGIDDGAPNLDASVKLIKGMQQLGYKKLVTTPHILWDIYQNTNEIIQQKFVELKSRLQQENIDVAIEAAAEYYLDDHVAQLLAEKKPLLSFGKKYVLVEFSLASLPL